MRACGFNGESLAMYLQGLLLCADKSTRRLAVILPDSVRRDWHSGDLSEKLICESYRMLLPQLRRRIGFVSHWTCSLSGEQISNIQVCFVHPDESGKALLELRQSGCLLLDLSGQIPANYRLSTPKLVQLMAGAIKGGEGERQFHEFINRLDTIFQPGDRLTAQRMESLLALFELQASADFGSAEREQAAAAVLTNFGDQALQNRTGLRDVLREEIRALLAQDKLPSEQMVAGLRVWLNGGDSDAEERGSLFRRQLQALYAGGMRQETLDGIAGFITGSELYAGVMKAFYEEKSDALRSLGSEGLCSSSFLELTERLKSEKKERFPGLTGAVYEFSDETVRTACNSGSLELLGPWLEQTAAFLGSSSRTPEKRLQSSLRTLLQILHTGASADQKRQAEKLLRAELTQMERHGQTAVVCDTILEELEVFADTGCRPLGVELDILLEIASLQEERLEKSAEVYQQFFSRIADIPNYSLHDYRPAVQRLSETKNPEKRNRLIKYAAAVELKRMVKIPGYVPAPERELVLFLLAGFKKEDADNAGDIEQFVFPYILRLSEKRRDFPWDQTLDTIESLGMTMPLLLFLVERDAADWKRVESRIRDRSASVRGQLLDRASNMETKARERLLRIEQSWFEEEAGKKKDSMEWARTLQQELQTVNARDNEINTEIQRGIRDAILQRFGVTETLAAEAPRLLGQLSTLCGYLKLVENEKLDKFKRSLNQILQADQCWDEQNVYELERIWSSKWGDTPGEQRLRYRFENDRGGKDKSAVAAVIALSCSPSGTIDKRDCWDKLRRCFPDGDDRILWAIRILHSPNNYTQEHEQEAARAMEDYLQEMIKRKPAAFLEPGTHTLKRELAGPIESLKNAHRFECYDALVSAMKKAGISVNAPSGGSLVLDAADWILLAVSFILSCALIVTISLGLLYLIDEQGTAIALFAIVIILIVIQFMLLSIRRRY
jgi:hypothetical protein